MAEPDRPVGATRHRPVGAIRRLCELLALTAFAIAQPFLDVTGRSPDFFLYRRANTNEMRLLLFAVVLLPPLGLWAVELVVGLFSKVAARVVHLVFMVILLAMIVVQLGKRLDLMTGIPLVVVAALVGAALAAVVARSSGVRQAIRYATPAPLLFAMLFTFASPSGALVRGGEVDLGEQVSVTNSPPVVLLFLDEFPLRTLLDANGRIDEKLFPNFARLAAMSNWYPNTTGVAGFTPFANPAMLNGKFPAEPVAASYIEYPESLFTLLAGTYDMRAYETIGEMCPPGMCVEVAAGRKTGLRALTRDSIDLTREIVSPYISKENKAEEFEENPVDVAKAAAKGQKKPGAMERFGEAGKNQPERFGPFLDDLRPLARPALHYMHLLLPHSPLRFLPSGNSYVRAPHTFPPDKPDPDKPPRTTPDEPLMEPLAKQRFVLQTAYTDNLIGTMLDRLEETGLLDEALLIVTADHGTGIKPRTQPRLLGPRDAPDIAWVPLFVKTPGQRKGKIDDRNVMSVDILPTIADVLDVDIPWKVDGVSTLGPPRTSPEKLWYDNPGTAEKIDAAKWLPTVRIGWATEVARPERGREGLFAAGPFGDNVGRKLTDLKIGAPSGITATLHENVKLDDVDPASGVVPAMLFGELDRPVGPESTWLLASVNGTVAGSLAAVPSDGTWRFVGVVDDQYFVKGKAEVRLFTVSGDTLRPVEVSNA